MPLSMSVLASPVFVALPRHLLCLLYLQYIFTCSSLYYSSTMYVLYRAGKAFRSSFEDFCMAYHVGSKRNFFVFLYRQNRTYPFTSSFHNSNSASIMTPSTWYRLLHARKQISIRIQNSYCIVHMSVCESCTRYPQYLMNCNTEACDGSRVYTASTFYPIICLLEAL